MKKLISFFIVVLICLISITPTFAAADIELYSKYAYLYDRDTSLVYLEQRSEERIYPASMTKILTTILALDKISNIHDQVTITAEDLNGLIEAGASVAGFYAGEIVTYEDLLYGTLLPSGADACNALARLLYGGVDQMVTAMNEKIETLNLKNTHFENVTGLHDEQHYTTVKDMAIILDNALNNQTFVEVFTSLKHVDSKGKRTWISTLERAKEMKNIDISHLDGAKSGYTDTAQLTLASTMTLEDHQFILVTAKADGQRTQNHVRDANTVYQYLQDHFKKFIIYKKDEIIDSCFILKSLEGFYDIQADQDISIIINQDINQDNINIEFEGYSIIEAPLKKGDKLGNIMVTYNNQSLYEYQVTLMQDIDTSILAMTLHYGVIIFIVTGLGYLIYKIIKKKVRN